MNNFVYFGLVVFLGTVVQGYGPKIHHKQHGSSHKSSHGSHHRPSHGPPHHGSFNRPPHRSPPTRPPHNIGSSHQQGHWDNSPIWKNEQDPWGSSDERHGSYDSYSQHDDSYEPFDDSYGPDSDSYGPDSGSYGPDSDSSGRFGPSYEDYGDWYDHFHEKKPCKRPDTKPPKRPPIPKPTQHTVHPRPRPTPRPTTAVIPPHTETTRFTPRTPRTTPRHTTVSTSTGTVWHPSTHSEDTTHWETTTSIPETTTEAEEEFTTISPEITNCIASCSSTPEYNPVCGTNGETYENEGKLFCASSCGINVSLRRRSVCPPPVFDFEDDNNENQPPPTLPPTTTISPSFGRTTSLSGFQRCMRQCRITASFAPVCGSDLVTYMNKDRLKCAESCGEVVEVICEKPCAACGFNPVTPKTTTLPPTTTPSVSNLGRTTLEPSVKECVDACPATQEYNPVCGSNRVTYTNPGHLLCAQLCGVAVTVRRFGQCPATTPSTTSTTEATSATYSPAVFTCIRRCPVTSEYNPVCGTDDLTYSNLGNLECAKYCGVDVELKYKTRCEDEFDLGPDGTTTTLVRTTPNFNGNKDSVTTVKTTPLFTSPITTRSTTRTIPTTTPATTPSSTSTTTAVPISSSTIGFSIPQDVLDLIFQSSTTVNPPTTTPKNSDVDEDLDLDARFGTETSTSNTIESDTDRPSGV